MLEKKLKEDVDVKLASIPSEHCGPRSRTRNRRSGIRRTTSSPTAVPHGRSCRSSRGVKPTASIRRGRHCTASTSARSCRPAERLVPGELLREPGRARRRQGANPAARHGSATTSRHPAPRRRANKSSAASSRTPRRRWLSARTSSDKSLLRVRNTQDAERKIREWAEREPTLREPRAAIRMLGALHRRPLGVRRGPSSSWTALWARSVRPRRHCCSLFVDHEQAERRAGPPRSRNRRRLKQAEAGRRRRLEQCSPRVERVPRAVLHHSLRLSIADRARPGAR